jgi:hypothetical protein
MYSSMLHYNVGNLFYCYYYGATLNSYRKNLVPLTLSYDAPAGRREAGVACTHGFAQ